MLCALPMLAGPLLSAAATSINVMIAGRFLAGVAIGLSSALVPLYISEVGGLTDSDDRGLTMQRQ
jgi:MFS family permease